MTATRRGHPMGHAHRGRLRQRVPICFFAVFGYMEDGSEMTPCDGQLVKCHLIRHQTLKDNGLGHLGWAGEIWVWGCGGPCGNAGHHGMLDHSRTLRIPRSAIPASTEEFALRHGLLWWLDREYGERI